MVLVTVLYRPATNEHWCRMTDERQELVLYLLMRKDMDSLNHAGKMVAQGAHAANHAAFEIGHNKFGATAMTQFAQWEKSTTQGFGTTIVLSGIHTVKGSGRLTMSDITRIVEAAKARGIPAGITLDPCRARARPPCRARSRAPRSR